MVNTRAAVRAVLAVALVTLTACSTQHSNIALDTSAPPVAPTSIAGTATFSGPSPSASTNPVLPSATPASSSLAPTSPARPPASRSPAQTYLALARTVYPATTSTELVDQGHRICTELTHGHSLDDLVGDLAGRLGNQALAQHLVTAARAAYCPGA